MEHNVLNYIFICWIWFCIRKLFDVIDIALCNQDWFKAKFPKHAARIILANKKIPATKRLEEWTLREIQENFEATGCNLYSFRYRALNLGFICLGFEIHILAEGYRTQGNSLTFYKEGAPVKGARWRINRMDEFVQHGVGCLEI